MRISWQDSRSFEEVEDIKRIVGEEKFYEITGYPLGTVLSVTEIMWWKNTNPKFMKMHIFLFWIVERVLHNLGVEGYYRDWSNGSLYGLMDIRKFEWDVELTKQLGIDPDKLPQLVPSGKVLGKVSKEAAELTGFAEGTLCIRCRGSAVCRNWSRCY
ncbi:MAG: FGGY family carbohydrate kinase [Mediterraneibacter gnavus]